MRFIIDDSDDSPSPGSGGGVGNFCLLTENGDEILIEQAPGTCIEIEH